jgi:hypothetical protein
MKPGQSYTYRDIADHFTGDEKMDSALTIQVGIELGYIEETPVDFDPNHNTFEITELGLSLKGYECFGKAISSEKCRVCKAFSSCFVYGKKYGVC